MANVLFSFIIVTALGALIAYGLSAAAKKFAVEKDERLEKLESIMPGANCGGCGFAGCSAYADAVNKGEAEIGKCSVGGAALAAEMGKIMGQEAPDVEQMVACVLCLGCDAKTKRDYKYHGVADCSAASILFSGPSSCKEGCIGLGSCMSVCSQNAIYRDYAERLRVDPDKCIGCGKCTTACPHNVIKLIPKRAGYAVFCNSHASGAEVTKNCELGCIGCKICETKFPDSGCKVENNLSTVNYSSSCNQLAEASKACPRKCIVKLK